MRPPRFAHSIADRLGITRYQEWACDRDHHYLVPTSLSAFFRVKEAECKWCDHEVDFEAEGEVGPSMVVR